MAYTKTNWINNAAPSISADNLNHIEQGIYDATEIAEGAVQDIIAKTVPTSVRSAIYTLLEKAVYTETGLSDEKQIVRAWISEATFLSLSPSTLNLIEDTPQTITASVSPSYVTVVWESTDETVATVVGGIVTGVSNGTCSIVASAGSLTASCEVTVTGFPELISIDAVYTQKTPIFDSDSLYLLRNDLVVTANYDDSSSVVLPSTSYALSGTLEIGTSTITVIYHGLTDTISVPVLKGLPTGYKRIEYIERPSGTSTTAGYNSTYFQPSSSDTVLVKMGIMPTASPSSSSGYFLINRASASNNTIGFGIGVLQDLTKVICFDGTTVGIFPKDGESVLNTRVDIECTKTSSGMSITDGTHTSEQATTPRAMATNLYVFAAVPSSGTTLQYPVFGRIYYLLIYRNGTLVVNFIPCKRESDNQVGFYDSIAETFRYAPPYIGGEEI